MTFRFAIPALTVALFVVSSSQASVTHSELRPGIFDPTSSFKTKPNLSSVYLQHSTIIPTGNSSSSISLPPGYNETYGYPDGIGALLVEGPFPYKNGPQVWDGGKNPWGAYGLIDAAGTLHQHYSNGANCDPIPSDSPFASTDVHPVPLTNGVKGCLLGCNTSIVSSTGVDPCEVGDISGDPVYAPMRCYNVGPGFAGGWGVCGYNCTALHKDEIKPCSQDDVAKDLCLIYCDSRKFPSTGNKDEK